LEQVSGMSAGGEIQIPDRGGGPRPTRLARTPRAER